MRWLEMILFASLAASAVSASSLAENNDASNQAKNLAQMNCGAQIECILPDGRPATIAGRTTWETNPTALIMDDDTISCPLQGGDTTFVITLPKTALIDRFTFVNENAAARGELKISVSNYRLAANSSKWTEVEGVIPFARKRWFNLSMLGVEAKYVRLSFHVEREGRIATLGLYGEESLRKFAEKQGRVIQVKNSAAAAFNLENVVNFNFANLYARAHVVFVSSGSPFAAERMIDDDTVTSFHFAKTDPHPTVVVELADREQLRRVSALYKMQAGQLEVYLGDKLPQDPGDLHELTPIATITDPGNGKAAVNFNPHGARYVALRWTPDSQNRNDDFELAEVNAFGDVPLSILQTTELRLYASNSPVQSLPGEGRPDFSNKLGTLADPPVVPELSP